MPQVSRDAAIQHVIKLMANKQNTIHVHPDTRLGTVTVTIVVGGMDESIRKQVACKACGFQILVPPGQPWPEWCPHCASLMTIVGEVKILGGMFNG